MVRLPENPDVSPGPFVHIVPVDAKEIKINFTTPLGTASNIYYALFSQLTKPNWDYKVQKVDEFVTVKPGSAVYGQTMAEKARMGEVINTNLPKAAQAVADYELAKHDLRKYKEILDYLKMTKGKEEEQRRGEHSLKSMFIDQVDVHTGALSLVQMVRRWPTIINDFVKMSDEDVDPEKVAKKLDVSVAEAHVLVKKNELYKEWKKLFGEAVKERYAGIAEIVASRKKYVDYYREWLKPYIARWKMIGEMYEEPSRRKEAFRSFVSTSEISSANKIFIWAWKDFSPEERAPYAVERYKDKFEIEPYDAYVKKLIFGKDGLVDEFPWLKQGLPGREGLEKARETIENWVGEIKKSSLEGKGPLKPDKLYYIWVEFDIERLTLATPGGKEVEDITFVITSHNISQNLFLVKLLELRANEENFERYLNQMIGKSVEEKPIEEALKIEYPEIYGKEVKISRFAKPEAPNWLLDVLTGFSYLIKRGPYETNFKDRITKFYAKAAAKAALSIAGFLKDKAGAI